MDNEYLQHYLARFEPIKQLPIGPTLSEEEAIKWLIDEAYRASKQMLRTHYKEDIIRFIVLAQCLNQHGYTLQWMKYRGVVGATKATVPTMTGVTKEVTHYADQRAIGVDDKTSGTD